MHVKYSKIKMEHELIIMIITLPLSFFSVVLSLLGRLNQHDVLGPPSSDKHVISIIIGK